jgi:MbtH protein
MFDDERRDFLVVVNNEDQYSIWPTDREPPHGWRAEGPPGPRADCLARVDRIWTDLRPLSLRTAMDAGAAMDEGNSDGARR